MITIKNLKKSFHSHFEPVLNGINLSLNKGDFCILMGSNGCGKSTLLKLISSEYAPDHGSIALQGKVAQVTQEVNVETISEMSLLENMAFTAIKKSKFSFYKKYKKNIIHQLKELNLCLEKYIDHPLKALSGGQRQMIATIMAINSNSEILLLDEHTSALDPIKQKILMEYTSKKIAALEITTLMITHKISDAIEYGNRLVLLEKGKIVFDIAGDQKKALGIPALFSRLAGGQNDF